MEITTKESKNFGDTIFLSDLLKVVFDTINWTCGKRSHQTTVQKPY